MSDMLEELYNFKNDVGQAILYKEPRVMGFVVVKMVPVPGTTSIYDNQLYRIENKYAAMAKFNRVRGTLRAMQTRRQNQKNK